MGIQRDNRNAYSNIDKSQHTVKVKSIQQTPTTTPPSPQNLPTFTSLSNFWRIACFKQREKAQKVHCRYMIGTCNFHTKNMRIEYDYHQKNKDLPKISLIS